MGKGDRISRNRNRPFSQKTVSGKPVDSAIATLLRRTSDRQSLDLGGFENFPGLVANGLPIQVAGQGFAAGIVNCGHKHPAAFMFS
jgi:hypothetical protein